MQNIVQTISLVNLAIAFIPVAAVLLLFARWQLNLFKAICALTRMLGIIKKHFTQSWLALGGFEQKISTSKQRYRRRGVWQKRFWEHTLRNQQDFECSWG